MTTHLFDTLEDVGGLLASDSDTRPQDQLDLDHLVDVLDDEKRDAARRAVHLIEQRGFSRGRDLGAGLEELLAG